MIKILGWLVVFSSHIELLAQPLTDQQVQRFNRGMPANSCLIRCPEDKSYAPHTGFQVCGGESTPICQCAGSEKRMANCESSVSSVQTNTPELLRRVYTDEDAPEYFRFKQYLRRREHRHSDDNAEFDSYLEPIRIELKKELALLESEVRCPSQVPRATGTDIAHLYAAIDDARDAIHLKYFAIAKAKLDADSFARLQRLYMDGGGFTSTTTNHWSRDPAELEASLKRVCDQIDNQTP